MHRFYLLAERSNAACPIDDAVICGIINRACCIGSRFFCLCCTAFMLMLTASDLSNRLCQPSCTYMATAPVLLHLLPCAELSRKLPMFHAEVPCL